MDKDILIEITFTHWKIIWNKPHSNFAFNHTYEHSGTYAGVQVICHRYTNVS